MAVAPSARAQTELVTATPTSTRIFYVANEITSPGADSVVWGMTPVLGSGLTKNFRQYQLHISATGAESWRWLFSSTRVIREGILYNWDTSQFEDGFYDFRLRAVQDSGQYEEFFVRRVEVRNANPPTLTPVVDELGTPVFPTATVTLTPTVTATATPDFSVRIPGGQGFYQPDSGTVLRGFVPIEATVNGTRSAHFRRYDLFISLAGHQAWEWIGSGEDQVWQDTIFVLDSRQFPDGVYDLQLRIVYRDSNYDQYFLTDLVIDNQGLGVGSETGTTTVVSPRPTAPAVDAPLAIFAPVAGARLGDQLDVIGTASDPDFLRWELHWSVAGQEKWSYLIHGEREIVDGMLAWLDISKIPPGPYDLRLRVVRRDGNYSQIFIRDLQVQPEN